MQLEKILGSVRDFGISKTLYALALRALNHVVMFKVLKGVTVEIPDPEFLRCDENRHFILLDESMLLKFARNEEYQLPEPFLAETLERGDQCYAILDGETLASYGWYSDKPTPIEPPDLILHFSKDYVYMYKGFTHPDYRGQRLHAIGMTKALENYLAKGLKGIISVVDSTNFSSLRSVYRMGYKDFGKIYILNIGSSYFLRSDAGCKRYQFYLEGSRTSNRWGVGDVSGGSHDRPADGPPKLPQVATPGPK